MTEQTGLKRSLSLPLLVLYGLGTTIGAGIYALIGKVAGTAGWYAPAAFLVASLMAGVTALSFAELSTRFPKSAGEAVYVRAGLGSDKLAVLVGLMVAAAGLVSAAAIVNGFVGYFQELLYLPRPILIVAFVALMAAVAAWGIGESVGVAAFLTLLEIAGLLAVIWAGGGSVSGLPERLPEMLPPFRLEPWMAILAGAFLAFYAFIGFEDMVNVAEEVKDVTRILPMAIVITFLATLALYFCLSVVAILVVPPDRLSESAAPLALVFREATGGSGAVISVIGVVATTNGALIQIIMASRILYGLSSQGLLPAWLGRVSPRTRTPVPATLAASGAVLAFALPLGLVVLAEVTSAITLTVFALVNLSLWRVKGRDPRPPVAWSLPRWLPALGFLVTGGLLLIEAIRFLAF